MGIEFYRGIINKLKRKKKVIEEVKKMGYKIDCCVYSRDKGENPYYDCEIKNVKVN